MTPFTRCACGCWNPVGIVCVNKHSQPTGGSAVVDITPRTSNIKLQGVTVISVEWLEMYKRERVAVRAWFNGAGRGGGRVTSGRVSCPARRAALEARDD